MIGYVGLRSDCIRISYGCVCVFALQFHLWRKFWSEFCDFADLFCLVLGLRLVGFYCFAFSMLLEFMDYLFVWLPKEAFDLDWANVWWNWGCLLSFLFWSLIWKFCYLMISIWNLKFLRILENVLESNFYFFYLILRFCEEMLW